MTQEMDKKDPITEAIVKMGGAENVAERYGVQTQTVYSWVRKGYIPSHRIALSMALTTKVNIRTLRPTDCLKRVIKTSDEHAKQLKIQQAIDTLRIYAPDRLKEEFR
jgi:transposase-like protein